MSKQAQYRATAGTTCHGQLHRILEYTSAGLFGVLRRPGRARRGSQSHTPAGPMGQRVPSTSSSAASESVDSGRAAPKHADEHEQPRSRAERARIVQRGRSAALTDARAIQKSTRRAAPSTLISINNLASVLRAQGKHEEADRVAGR